MQNNIETAKLRLEQASNELKTHLTNLRNCHNEKLKAGHKQKAANALKKKKMYEAQLLSLEQNQFNLESMKIQSEMMKDQIGVFQTLKEVNDTQKSLMNQMNVNDMYAMSDKMLEMKDDMEEISNVFADAFRVDVDESELDAELDELDFNNQENDFEMFKPNQKVLSKKEIDEKNLEDELLK